MRTDRRLTLQTLMVVAASLLAPPRAGAQGAIAPPAGVDSFAGPVDVFPGQMVRVRVFNGGIAVNTGNGNDTVDVQLHLLDAQTGAPLAPEFRQFVLPGQGAVFNAVVRGQTDPISGNHATGVVVTYRDLLHRAAEAGGRAHWSLEVVNTDGTIALLLPAIQAAREAARRSQCILAPTGMRLGQRLLIRVFNMSPAPVVLSGLILNAESGRILQSVNVPAGPFQGGADVLVGDFTGDDRAGLAVAGFFHILPFIEQDNVAVSAQVVDASGKTALMAPLANSAESAQQ